MLMKMLKVNRLVVKIKYFKSSREHLRISAVFYFLKISVKAY